MKGTTSRIEPLVDWLLTQQEPWVILNTRLDLLGQSEEAQEVKAAYGTLKKDKSVGALLDEVKVWPQEKRLGKAYDPKDALWKLSLLADFGIKRDDARVAAVAKKVLDMFGAGEFDVATLYFSEFKSVISQKPTALQLIPASISTSSAGAEKGSTAIYEYEPSEEEVLSFLLTRNIATQIFRGLLENAASEQGSRMSAMDSATRNAGDMINKLTIKYNRQRQANITKELIEIISGAEAL